MIDASKWKWFGSPGHLIVARDCRFHLCTQVGPHLISTVGEYFPDAPAREILAELHGVRLKGQGDARRHDYLSKIGFEEIGANRKYETMVFRVNRTVCKCGCGAPRVSDWANLDDAGYNDRGSANRGHIKLCMKYAKRTAGGKCNAR